MAKRVGGQRVGQGGYPDQAPRAGPGRAGPVTGRVTGPGDGGRGLWRGQEAGHVTVLTRLRDQRVCRDKRVERERNMDLTCGMARGLVQHPMETWVTSPPRAASLLPPSLPPSLPASCPPHLFCSRSRTSSRGRRRRRCGWRAGRWRRWLASPSGTPTTTPSPRGPPPSPRPPPGGPGGVGAARGEGWRWGAVEVAGGGRLRLEHCSVTSARGPCVRAGGAGSWAGVNRCRLGGGAGAGAVFRGGAEGLVTQTDVTRCGGDGVVVADGAQVRGGRGKGGGAWGW